MVALFIKKEKYWGGDRIEGGKTQEPCFRNIYKAWKSRSHAIIETQRIGNDGNKNLEVIRSRWYEIYGKWLKSPEKKKRFYREREKKYGLTSEPEGTPTFRDQTDGR